MERIVHQLVEFVEIHDTNEVFSFVQHLVIGFGNVVLHFISDRLSTWALHS